MIICREPEQPDDDDESQKDIYAGRPAGAAVPQAVQSRPLSGGGRLMLVGVPHRAERAAASRR